MTSEINSTKHAQHAPPSKKKKRRAEPVERKKTSWVWQYFEKDASKRLCAEGEKFVLCQVDGCVDREIRVVKGNTTILSHHLRKEHEILPLSSEDERSEEMNVESTTPKTPVSAHGTLMQVIRKQMQELELARQSHQQSVQDIAMLQNSITENRSMILALKRDLDAMREKIDSLGELVAVKSELDTLRVQVESLGEMVTTSGSNAVKHK